MIPAPMVSTTTGRAAVSVTPRAFVLRSAVGGWSRGAEGVRDGRTDFSASPSVSPVPSPSPSPSPSSSSPSSSVPSASAAPLGFRPDGEADADGEAEADAAVSEEEAVAEEEAVEEGDAADWSGRAEASGSSSPLPSPLPLGFASADSASAPAGRPGRPGRGRPSPDGCPARESADPADTAGGVVGGEDSFAYATGAASAASSRVATAIAQGVRSVGVTYSESHEVITPASRMSGMRHVRMRHVRMSQVRM